MASTVQFSTKAQRVSELRGLRAVAMKATPHKDASLFRFGLTCFVAAFLAIVAAWTVLHVAAEVAGNVQNDCFARTHLSACFGGN